MELLPFATYPLQLLLNIGILLHAAIVLSLALSMVKYLFKPTLLGRVIAKRSRSCQN